MRLIHERGRPLPSALRIVPSCIVWWNLTKGMTDVFSRVMMNVKANFKQMHPYVFIWIRMVITMVYNAHLLHRIFAIEERLKTPGSFSCLKQLRRALNSEASFVNSLANLARGPFKLSHSLFKPATASGTALPMEVSLEHESAGSHSASFGKLTDSSRNASKMDFLNTPAGVAIRRPRAGPLHSPKGDQNGNRRCILCNCKTSVYCDVCSDNTPHIRFYACKSPSTNLAGRTNHFTCFQMMHNSDVLHFTEGRHKINTQRKSEALLQNASGLRDAKRLKMQSATAEAGPVQTVEAVAAVTVATQQQL